MVEGYNGIGTFHSVYNYNLNSFLSWSHVTYGSSGWSMGVHEKRANLDEFLGIKYYILPSNDTNVPFGYTKIMETNGKTVYRNDNHIELGFSFDRIYQTTVMDSSYRSYNGATEKNEILYKFLQKESKKMKGILDNLEKYREKNEQRICELSDQQKLIEEGLYYFSDKE